MEAYHGTTKENVESIKQAGFRKGTYFAYRLMDALHFGGPCVFRVVLSDDPEHWKGEQDGWQFHLRDSQPTSVINDYQEYPGVYYRPNSGWRGNWKRSLCIIGPDGTYAGQMVNEDIIDAVIEFLNDRWHLPKVSSIHDKQEDK